MDNDRPIRVLQIIGLACGGGVESVIMNYYRHIDRNKIQFDFVVHKNPYYAFAEEAKSLGGTVYEVTPYTDNIIKFTYEIYKIIKNGNYKIVHSNMNSLSGFSLMAAWLAGSTIRILHNHTTDNPAEGLRTQAKRILRPFARLFANKYFACSNFAANWMYGQETVNKGKVTIINNAIDLDKFAFNQEKRDKLRQELGISDKFVIGHVGRFVQTKNHDFLIDVFNEVQKEKKNSVLLLIGDGPLKEILSAKVNSLGLTDKVFFLGVSNDVANLYNAMDVFVFPSFYEGLGMAAVEAQVNGLSVVASIGVPQQAKLMNNMLFLPLNKNIQLWSKRVVELTRCSKNNEIMKAAVNLRFDIKEEVNNLTKLYFN